MVVYRINNETNCTRRDHCSFADSMPLMEKKKDGPKIEAHVINARLTRHYNFFGA